MRQPLETTLDPSVFALLRAKRRAQATDVEARLAALRRLRERYQLGVMQRERETTAEQSWNEQLFAKVLGYRTLLSHDRLPFHLKPKHYNTDGRYDDFSLGFFGVRGSEVVIVSAELKGPGADLKKPQDHIMLRAPAETRGRRGLTLLQRY